jgi:competence ComEA-like helix-hairpin-helix protein
MSLYGEGHRTMKKLREIYLLLLFALIGWVVLLAHFAFHNREASVNYTAVFSPCAEITHTEPAATIPSQTQININTATAEQLQTLPGIGPGLAQRILDYRQENGPFVTTAELSKVPGIGVTRLENLLGYITTGG